MPSANFLAMPFGDLRRRIDRSAAYDWAMRCPIMIYCAFILFGDVGSFRQQVLADPSAFQHFDVDVMIAMLARISQWMFVILLSLQPLFRLRSIRKSDEILPRVVALVAVAIPLMFMQLQRAAPDATFNLMTIIIALFANVMCLVTASFLGRSLSVMPEARRLVCAGPYGIVRHPLYLSEMLATAGMVLQYRSLPALGLFLLAIVLQLARARWEEDVLARAFPDFAAYRGRTSFLFPRDPVHFFAAFLVEPGVRRRTAFIVASMVAALAVVATVLPRLIV